jgi:hypothetical protein
MGKILDGLLLAREPPIGIVSDLAVLDPDQPFDPLQAGRSMNQFAKRL